MTRHHHLMTAAEAHENIASMRKETPRNAMVRLLQLVAKSDGCRYNLTDEARAVYRAELDRLTA